MEVVQLVSDEIDMDKIVDGIYLGSVYAAQDINSLTRLGITHVLTIDIQPLKYDLSESITYKFVYCVDVPESDLLSKFEECFKFIDDALSQSGRTILIHCLAGMSRSSTIVAGYLMYRDKMCLDEALGTIKEKRPRIKPNPGFMRQLELFEKMGSTIDSSNELLRKYKLSTMADRMQAGAIDEFPAEVLLPGPGEAPNQNDSYFKCRKCRQALFRSSGIMTHTVGQGEAAFDWRGKIHKSREVDLSEDRMCTQSLFIEPVRWMGEFINQLDGKILCPKCHAKLGSFIWYGEKCPCGAWVAPAFHIQKSKVDEVMTKLTTTSQIKPISQMTSGQDIASSGVLSVQINDNSMSSGIDDSSNGVRDSILDEILQPIKNKESA